MTRTEILNKAERIVSRDRNATHGEPEDSFRRIAAYWSTYLNRDLTAVDVGIMMTLMKIARAEWNPKHDDNWVDAAGYMACAGEIAGGK